MKLFATLRLLNQETHEPTSVVVGSALIEPFTHLWNMLGSQIYVHVIWSPLSAGKYGFHLHNTFVSGHYDPERTRKHEGPSGKGHRGDLPRLTFAEGGTCAQSVVSRRLSPMEFLNRVLIIHGSNDNYSDYPEPNGGCKGRIIGGLVEPR